MACGATARAELGRAAHSGGRQIPGIVLSAPYAMSGTEISCSVCGSELAYVVCNTRIAKCSRSCPPSVIAYKILATPLYRDADPLPGLLSPYALPGTDIASRDDMSGTDIAPPYALGDVRYCYTASLRAYAL
eukprot:3941614-Rhodomonas_salina.2